MTKNNILEINGLSKTFESKKEKVNVLDDINFNIEDGEIVCIVGTSGCGKSTLLNIIGGLDNNYDGNVIYNFDKEKVGYMLQDSALFPWLNIYDNATLACNIKKINNDKYINYLLNRYGLSDFKNKYPDKISGGMKQRVALIRTISYKPKLLLLDEPFAALDYQTRIAISNDIYNLIKENKISTILITHDISEAISMADRIIVLSKRPAHIKSVYNIKLNHKGNPSENRSDEKFSYYYELIRKDLDIF